MRKDSRSAQPMVPNDSLRVPLIQRVFHPADFSEARNVTFAHALFIALLTKAKLTILPVSGSEEGSWTDFQEVRSTLERWGLLPSNSQRTDVLKLGINVRKVQTAHEDPVESIRTYLESYGTDLIVPATEQEKRELRWFGRSLATDIASQSGNMTIFVPKGSTGLVAVDDGSTQPSLCLRSSIAVPSR